MKAYVYRADLYCESCVAQIKLEISTGLVSSAYVPANPSDESSFDSDTYPKGPYCGSELESDSPSHCGQCGLFLENPLTADGEAYVRESVRDYKGDNIALSVVGEWRDFYSYLFA